MITEIPPAVATTAAPAGTAGSDEDRVIQRDGSGCGVPEVCVACELQRWAEVRRAA